MTAEEMLANAGIGPDDVGPFCKELRAKYEAQVAGGLCARHWSWGPDAFKISAEERARHLLGMDWRFERGHTCRIEAIDGLMFFQHVVRDGKYVRKFRWRTFRDVIPWLGDRVRSAAMHVRILRDKLLFPNPYI